MKNYKKKKKGIVMWKLHKIQNLVTIIKVLLECSHTHFYTHFFLWLLLHYCGTVECQKSNDPASLKYLLSGHYGKCLLTTYWNIDFVFWPKRTWIMFWNLSSCLAYKNKSFILQHVLRKHSIFWFFSYQQKLRKHVPTFIFFGYTLVIWLYIFAFCK